MNASSRVYETSNCTVQATLQKIQFLSLLMLVLATFVNFSVNALKPPCQVCLSSTLSNVPLPKDILLTPDDRCLFVATENNINAYSINNGILQFTNSVSTNTPTDYIESLAFSPENNCVIAYSITSGIGYITIFAFDQETCTLKTPFVQQFQFTRIFAAGDPQSMTLASDGKFLAVVVREPTSSVNVYSFQPNSCKVDIASKQSILLSDNTGFFAVTFTQDSKYLAIAGGQFNAMNIFIYNTDNFNLSSSVFIPNLSTSTLRFSPNNDCLSAISAFESLVTIPFDKINGLLGVPLITLLPGALAHAYSPDGTCLAVTNDFSGTINVYNICRNSCDLIDFSDSAKVESRPLSVEYSGTGAYIGVANELSNSVQLFNTNCQ